MTLILGQTNPTQRMDELVQLPGGNWLLVIGVLVVAWYGSKLLTRFIRPNVTRHFRRRSVTDIVLRLLRAGAMVAAVLFALGMLGVEVTGLFLSVTVLSALLAVILAPIATDFVAGFLILVNRPYEINDMIEIVDEENRGYVEDITLRYTRILTLDNTFLVIPNSTIYDRDVKNYSASDERTRVSIEFTVTYEGDLEEAQRLLERATERINGVISGGPAIRLGGTRYPAEPRAFITEFGDHGVHIDLRFWVEKPYLPIEMRSKVHESVWEELDDANVEMAYPHTHLMFDETSGRARIAVERSQNTEAGLPSSEQGTAD
ncbi:mechanosensitive ion channel family protein [Saliphagus sp. GCM10025334]|uniref:mechanosensitive ion channel family protein n=1 Tax=Natronosalvus caseinilyticus TaxID=2953747 RepID=UPI0028AE58A7|nr:mechanosensitive ion channel family protein [Natronosalvus caseinilyticus]